MIHKKRGVQIVVDTCVHIDCLFGDNLNEAFLALTSVGAFFIFRATEVERRTPKRGENMRNQNIYREMYYKLYSEACNIIDNAETIDEAKKRLIVVTQETEEMYIDSEE